MARRPFAVALAFAALANTAGCGGKTNGADDGSTAAGSDASALGRDGALDDASDAALVDASLPDACVPTGELCGSLRFDDKLSGFECGSTRAVVVVPLSDDLATFAAIEAAVPGIKCASLGCHHGICQAEILSTFLCSDADAGALPESSTTILTQLSARADVTCVYIQRT
jgi:hypothetical protein